MPAPLRLRPVVLAVVLLAGCGARHKTVSSPSHSYYAPAGESVAATGMAETEAIRVSSDSDDDAPAAAPMPVQFQGAPAPAPIQAAATSKIPEKVVVEGNLRVEVEDVRATAAALRAAVEAAGGRVVTEALSGAAESWNATLQVRVPPGQVDGVIELLGAQGEITSKVINGTDVSRTLFEQEIEIGNKRATLERLRKLLDQGGLTMDNVLAIERELTRLRGEIEQLEGSKRYLEDRVQLATLTIYLVREDGAQVLMSPRSKFYPGPRFAMLTLLDPDGRARTRLGGGFAVHVPEPRLSFELDVFEEEASPDGGRHRATLATFGGAAYSDFLGRGRRRFLNPYLGLRLGYGYLDGNAFVVQGDVGVELFKTKHVLFDLDVRATGFLADDRVDLALVTGAGIVVAF